MAHPKTAAKELSETASELEVVVLGLVCIFGEVVFTQDDWQSNGF